VPLEDTASNPRDAGYNVSVLGHWRDSAIDDVEIAWVRAGAARLAAHSRDGGGTSTMAPLTSRQPASALPSAKSSISDYAPSSGATTRTTCSATTTTSHRPRDEYIGDAFTGRHLPQLIGGLARVRASPPGRVRRARIGPWKTAIFA
jgi:hypothetical protein